MRFKYVNSKLIACIYLTIPNNILCPSSVTINTSLID